MAKTKGPLFSLEAHGSIKKTITYSKRKSGQKTRSYNKPNTIPSAKQRGRRRITEFLVAQWQGMSDADKNTWRDHPAGKRLGITGYMYFLKAAQADLTGTHGLIGYWPMNEIISGEVQDFTENGNNGLLKPTPPTDIPTLTKSMTKKTDMGLNVEGANKRIQITADDSINIPDEFTIEYLIKFRDKTGDQTVFAKQNYPTNGIRDLYVEGQLHFLTCTGGSPFVRASNTYLENEKWYLITYTIVKATRLLEVFVNGKREFYNSVASVMTNPTGEDIYMGNVEALDRNIKGTIDEFCYYNRILTSEEISRRWKFISKNIKK